MTKMKTIYAFVAMVGVIGVAFFGVFKWMDSQQDADTDQAQWMWKQEVVHSQDSVFKVQVLDEFQKGRVLMVSAIHIGLDNQQAIKSNRVAIMTNRSTIVQQIEKDTSLSREETIEMLKGLYEGIEDLKKGNSFTPY